MQRFKLKTDIIFGQNALEALKSVQGKNVVVFTDKFLTDNGTANRIKELLTSCEKVSIYSDVIPDPPVETVASGLKFLIENEIDLVVAVGGGSAIDAAKGTVYVARKHTGKYIRLIAVPTTSGTGSEVTEFAVISDRQAGKKIPLVDEEMLPEMAILSCELTASVPPTVTADTGFDVLTHALEAYISKNANEFSDALAEKAVELWAEYIVPAYKNGNDMIAREKMHTASCLAGIAFNEAGLGVNHSIAHALGAHFHIPHGRANAMLLPHVLRYNTELDIKFCVKNANATADKLEGLARRLGYPGNSPDVGVRNMIHKIKEYQRWLNIPQTLGEAGVTIDQYKKAKQHIIESAIADACTATNPRVVDAKGVEEILDKIDIFI